MESYHDYMKSLNFNTLSVFTACVLSVSSAFSQTYYWTDGSFNSAVFYPNADGTGDAAIPNWTDGTTVIDKATTASGSGQYAFGVDDINISAWNDTTENTADWHMYFSGSNSVLTMANMTKSSGGILKIRTSTGSSGSVLNVTDSMDLSAGSLRIGTDREFGLTSGWAFNTVDINTLNMSGTATATFAVSKSMTVDTVNMNGGKWWVGKGTETTSGDENTLHLQINNLNIGDRTESAMLNEFSVSANSITVQEFNVTGTTEATINNFVRPENGGVFNIVNMTVDEKFLSGGYLFLSNGTLDNTYKVDSFTSNTGVAAGGEISISGIVDFGKTVHTGAGASLGGYTYDLFFSGNGTAVLNDITVENYAKIGYGKFDGNNTSQQQVTIGGVSLGNVSVNTGGYLWIVTDNVQFDSDSVINVSGVDSNMVIMNGYSGSTTSMLGTIKVSDGGYFTMRRRSGNPFYSFNNVELKSAASDALSTKFQISSDTTYVVGGASIESLTFNPYAEGDSGKMSYANLFTEKYEVGAESMYVGNVHFNEYAKGAISVAQNTRIGAFSTDAYSSVDLTNSTPEQAFSITVDGDYNNAGSYLILRENLTLNVKGDFVNTSYWNSMYGISCNLASQGALLDVDGAFVNNGVANLGENLSEGKTSNASFGGIRSDYIQNKLETFRIYNSNGGTLNITLDGDGTYIYGNRIHTFGRSSTDMGTSVINFNKTGSGVQYFASNYIYYRGTTTISNGEMYICANGLNNDLNYGVENIVLTGGKFGACGAMGADGSVASIGTVKAENFTWSSGADVAVDFDVNGNCDLILVSGSFLKDSSDADDAKYNFVFSGSVAANTEYKILGWEDVSSVDFTEEDFTYSSSSDIEGSFSIRDNSLYFTTAIPEPSTYAAIFGIAALYFAALRRRGRK